MRPRRIVIRAFGPYAGEQVLDFRALGERSFFLISGPTGAGKTTVLDAICYALYGTTSGNEREGRQMRSDHAEAGLPTQVTFDFTRGDEVYRVERSPEQERPKLRGSGTTIEPPRATLWRRTGMAEDDATEGTVVADRPSDVDAAVERLMGFHAGQFRQVIMLPQGDFRRLLMADSKEREAILETLFRTEWYSQIQEALRQARLALERDRETWVARRDALLVDAGAKNRLDLIRRQDAKRAELVTADESVGRLRAEEEAARKALEDARAVAALLEEVAAATKERERLDAERPAVDGRRSACTRARKAALLAAPLGHRDERAREAADADASRRKTEAALRAATDALDGARAEHAREQARESERDAVRGELARLTELAGKSTELEAAERELSDASAAVAADEEAVGKAAATIATLEAGVQALADELDGLRREAAHLRPRGAAVDEARRRKLDHDRLERQRAAVATATDELAARRRRADELAASLDVEHGELLAVEAAWSQGHAALLAAELRNGEPCPVCGSTEHPRPATAGGEVPRRDDLDQLRERERRRRRELEAARTAQTDQSGTLAQARGQLVALEKSLGEWAERDRSDIDEALVRAEEELAVSERAARRSEQTERSLAQRTQELADARRAKDEADTRLREHSTPRRARAEARVEQARALLPPELRGPGAVEAARTKASERADAMRRALDAAVSRLAECEKGHASGVRDAANANAAAVAAAERVAAAEKQLRDAIAEADFRDEVDVAAARLSDVEIDRLEAEIERFDHLLAAARDRERRALAAAEGNTAPDLGGLTKAAAEIAAAHEATKKRRHDLARDIDDLERSLWRLDELQTKLDALDQRYAVVGRVADVAAGKQPNRAGVPFQRFVLAALLDVVLDSASARLRIMSNNRYTLERSRERGSRRTTTGLELEVWDAYTGNARPVATLSGGESFLASLSLALGLADVVQTYAGGIHLDTIFVDEGFGTLDPEALDLALRALEDLQRGGRLVGIISHVPELRERVPARLEVTTGRRGSSARFVFG